ncbi:hypothetical protein [Leptospira alstonii]|uniref:hypothetical protein n=1 Tax=Leptospira alstonii TaxID=28452 RepID=UPI00077439BD|nr:hypothetical protein [Leptospira alstonii]
MNKETISLVIDESGAKGYSKTGPKNANEIGIAVGLFFLNTRILTDCNISCSKILEAEGIQTKHITDLWKTEQTKAKRLIEKFYNILKIYNIPCLHRAIYVSGFHNEFKHKQLIKEQVFKKAKENNIGLSQNDKKESLHALLIRDVIARAVEFFYVNFGHTNINLDVVLDRVDMKVEKLIKKTVVDFFGENRNEESVYYLNYYDITGKKKVKEGPFSFKMETKLPKSFDLNSVSVNISNKLNSLTFAADIVANSLNRYLNLHSDHPLNSLHSLSLFNDFELKDIFYLLYDNQESSVSDKIYRHPELDKTQNNA